MMRKFLMLLAFTALTTVAFAQDDDDDDGPSKPPSKNAKQFYGEFGGNGLLFTANYDFRFGQRQKGLGMRLGLGFLGGSGGGIITIPVAINNLSGKAPNFLEVGLGATYASFSDGDDFFDDASSILIVPSIGYRYQPRGKGFTGRIAFTPLISTGGGFFTYGGISAGYKF